MAQTQVRVDASVSYQTIKGFGASDAWNVDWVGKYWDSTVNTTIAQKLFSKEFDEHGNPLGIGLSRWRFNIGAGSAEQGDTSIHLTERRVECFLNEDGSYDWSKQSGQQYYLRKAQTYGVEQLVAFVNSPPRFFTKSRRANSDNADYYGHTNLKDDCFDDYAVFLANVLKHFEIVGIPIAQVSPVNEPQFAWNTSNGQEGCPWVNTDITKLIGELNTVLLNKGLSTQILLSEAASYVELYKENNDKDKSDQLVKFYTKGSPEYLGGYSKVMPGLGAHSYWTDDNDSILRSARENLYQKSISVGGVELYQTEYNLLSKEYDDYLKNTIFLGKMLYADLSIANVSIWDYWTAIERERWGQKNRFYLIRLQPTGGNLSDLHVGGTISVDKNLWALGNYSRFIRPGYKRIKTIGASDLTALMGCAFMAPDSSKIVVVYVNWGEAIVPVIQHFENLPTNVRIEKITPYVTDKSHNLGSKSPINGADTYEITPWSITTMVVSLCKN